MKIIHKVAAMVIKDNTFLMVRKVGQDHWMSLGGRPEIGESEEQTLIREVKEEVNCTARIIKKLGDFEARAADDDAIVKLSVYLCELQGAIMVNDPEHEIEEYKFIEGDYKKQ